MFKSSSGKIVPAGNLSLIGAEVEWDQLAPLECLRKETKVEEKNGLGLAVCQYEQEEEGKKAMGCY